MIRKYVLFIGFIGVISFTLACTGTKQSRLEMDYGTSHELSKFNQILNPEAEKNLEPVERLDGRAGHANVHKYQKSFEKPAKEPRYIFSIGTE